MKSLTDEISKILENEEKKPQELNIESLKKTIEEMKNLGIDIKAGYNLPLIDTIGRQFYLKLNSRNR